jgi:aminoglycoside phosphotransferase (APT) family kinase protein
MRRVTPERRRLIAAALEREPQRLIEIDDGYDYEVALIDDEWVFRFPRRGGVEEALRMEVALLPLIADALPVAVPRFELVSPAPAFVAYRLIHGRPFVDEDPTGVREFLDALHALDASALPAERSDWVASYAAQCLEFERLAVPLFDVDEKRQARRLFAEVETLVGFEPSLVHADLGPEHLLVEGGKLAGVIDWGDARIGDPALDYSWLLNVPFASWEVNEELRRRARFYHRLAPWFEVHYGVLTGRPANVERGLTAVRSRL